MKERIVQKKDAKKSCKKAGSVNIIFGLATLPAAQKVGSTKKVPIPQA